MNTNRKEKKSFEDNKRRKRIHKSNASEESDSAEVSQQHNEQKIKQDLHSRNPITSPFGNCPNVSLRYKKQCRIGEGTYGVVYKALDLVTKEMVALKRSLPHYEASDGFPVTTLREIQILKELQGHDNIVQLKEVAVSSSQRGVFLVFEYAHFDLANLVDEYYDRYNKGPFTIPETKCLVMQLLSAIDYLHSKCIIHRDLKLSNLLYDKHKGLLKLCDFGLARRISKRSRQAFGDDKQSSILHISPPNEQLTPKVVSLWYRPPELLLNAEHYDFAVDSWGLGCIIAEVLLGVPLFKGKSEINQLKEIANLLGQPTIETWPGLANMPLLKSGSCELPFNVKKGGRNNKNGRSNFLDKFSDLSTSGILLLSNLLQYNPESRWTVENAITSEWFKEYPLPSKLNEMPSFPWKK